MIRFQFLFYYWFGTFIWTLLAAALSNGIWGVPLRYGVEVQLSVTFTFFIIILVFLSVAALVQIALLRFSGVKLLFFTVLFCLFGSLAPILAFELYSSFSGENIRRAMMYTTYFENLAIIIHRPAEWAAQIANIQLSNAWVSQIVAYYEMYGAMINTAVGVVSTIVSVIRLWVWFSSKPSATEHAT